MKVVLDTNVLVSGLIFGGTPGRILSAWAHGEISLVLSPEVFEEYRRVCWELSKDREQGSVLNVTMSELYSSTWAAERNCLSSVRIAPLRASIG